MLIKEFGKIPGFGPEFVNKDRYQKEKSRLYMITNPVD